MSSRPGNTNPGDLVLTHGHSVVHRAIRAAQAVRFRGDRRPYAFFNHAAIIADRWGEVIEATAGGVRRSHLASYTADGYQYVVVDAGADQHDRAQIVAFAESCLGQQYGFLTIAALLAWTVFGGKLVIGLDGTEICSGLAAQALVRDGANFPRQPTMCMPADLAEYFNVKGA